MDADIYSVVKAQNEHNHVANDRKIEAMELQVQSGKQSIP